MQNLSSTAHVNFPANALRRGAIALGLLFLASLSQGLPAEPAIVPKAPPVAGSGTQFAIGWANLQWPLSTAQTLGVTNQTENIYGQVWIDGITSQPGATTNLIAQVGMGPEGSNPLGNRDWVWVEAAFNVDSGNNDEFKATLIPESTGSFDYIYRYSATGGKDWLYADLGGPLGKQVPPKPGKLIVKSSGDTLPPRVPEGFGARSAKSGAIVLHWNEETSDPTLYGYEVLRSAAPGGPYATVARITANSYRDSDVRGGATNYYVVRALDRSFNRSRNSSEVQAVGAGRKVTVTFNVTVPKTTETLGRSINLAGTLDLLEGGLGEWDTSGAKLTQTSATQWTLTLSGNEGTHIEYKYALDSWDYVEKNDSCEEMANRELTLVYGKDGQQIVNDKVANWRNVAPCKE